MDDGAGRRVMSTTENPADIHIPRLTELQPDSFTKRNWGELQETLEHCSAVGHTHMKNYHYDLRGIVTVLSTYTSFLVLNWYN
jgi:hypothetical protein